MASLKAHYKDIDLLIPEQLHSVTPTARSPPLTMKTARRPTKVIA